MCTTVFNIPVYLRSYERYYKEQEKHESRYIGKISQYTGNSLEEEIERLKRNREYERLCWWPPWKYNDIVGWISINYDGRFFAELYRLDKLRTCRDPRHRKGNIVLSGKMAELPTGGKDNELKEELLTILEKINAELKKIGLYADIHYWKRLVSSLDCTTFIKVQSEK